MKATKELRRLVAETAKDLNGCDRCGDDAPLHEYGDTVVCAACLRQIEREQATVNHDQHSEGY